MKRVVFVYKKTPFKKKRAESNIPVSQSNILSEQPERESILLVQKEA